MALFIGLLTFMMVLDCLILVLLVLIQLPKKDAGAGVAFGGAATDALFGAGSGNVLTKTTKYAAVAFFVLAIVLSILQSHQYHSANTEFRKELEHQPQQSPAIPRASTPNTATPLEVPPPPTATNGMNLLLPHVSSTNATPSLPQK
jgi:preprotein translocase subunit SecG